jgi:AcrR family transcriptional regulator
LSRTTPVTTARPIRRHRPRDAAKSASTRERILEASLECFADRGYEATTMNEIGRRAGVTGPAIYRHFTGKQQLFAEVWRWASGDLISGAIARAEVLSPAEAALELLRAHAEMCAYHPAWVRIWLTSDGKVPKAAARAIGPVTRRYHAVWTAAVAALRGDLPPTQRTELVALVRGAATSTVWYGTVLPSEQRAALLVQAGLAVLYGTAAGEVAPLGPDV